MIVVVFLLSLHLNPEISKNMVLLSEFALISSFRLEFVIFQFLNQSEILVDHICDFALDFITT